MSFNTNGVRTVSRIINLSFKVTGIKQSFDEASQLLTVLNTVIRVAMMASLAVKALTTLEAGSWAMDVFMGPAGMELLLAAFLGASSIMTLSKLGVNRG